MGTIHHDQDDNLVLTSQDIEYLHRGDGLSRFSLVEYACLVRRTKITDSKEPTVGAKKSKAGRHESERFRYSLDYGLREMFIQQLTSIVTVPNFMGYSVESIPKFNHRAKDGEENDATNNTFFEFMLAIYLPWPAPGAAYDDVNESLYVRFVSFLTKLMDGALFRLENGNYTGPPGYNGPEIDSSSAGVYF